MLFVLIGFMLLASACLLCLKKDRALWFLLGMCGSLMIQFSGILIFIAKKGGYSKDILRFLFFSTRLKMKAQYLYITLDALGYMIGVGRYLFPVFLLELALHYSMLPLLRRRPSLSLWALVLPTASLICYYPPLFRTITRLWPWAHNVLVQGCYFWIIAYVAAALLLLLQELFAITIHFCKRQFAYKVRDAFHKAQETPADENQFRQLRLNQWVKQSIRWMPMDKWDECGGVVDPYQLEGRACYAGLDLSSTSDLTALVLVFPPSDEDEPYTVMPFFWLPEETLSLRVRRDHVPYDQWTKRGFIHTTEGNVVHYGYIEQFICQLGERYNIREIAHDRWNATMMVQTLEDDGFTMVPFGQGFKDMSPPTKELMRLVLEHKLCHGGHPVLRWNMDNAYVRTDPAGNLKLDKEKSTEKVDGAVALVMALDRAMKNLNGGDSIYNHRGFIVL